MEEETGSKKRLVLQVCILSPYLFNLYVEYIMRKARQESQAGIKIAGRNINNLRKYHFNGRKPRRTKESLDEGKRGVKKLAANSAFKKRWSWHPVFSLHGRRFTVWTTREALMENSRGKTGNSERLFSWAPKSLWMVTAATKWKMLAPWKKSCDKPRQCIEKQRHYFATKVHIVKAMVFPVVMYRCVKECESPSVISDSLETP